MSGIRRAIKFQGKILCCVCLFALALVIYLSFTFARIKKNYSELHDTVNYVVFVLKSKGVLE